MANKELGESIERMSTKLDTITAALQEEGRKTRAVIDALSTDFNAMDEKIKDRDNNASESLNASLKQIYNDITNDTSSLQLKIDKISDKMGSLIDILERAYSYHQSIAQSLIDEGAFEVAKGYISFLAEKSKPRPRAARESRARKKPSAKKSEGTKKAESTTV